MVRCNSGVSNEFSRRYYFFAIEFQASMRSLVFAGILEDFSERKKEIVIMTSNTRRRVR